VQCPQLFARHFALGLAGQLDPSQGLARHIMNGAPRGQADEGRIIMRHKNFRTKSAILLVGSDASKLEYATNHSLLLACTIICTLVNVQSSSPRSQQYLLIKKLSFVLGTTARPGPPKNVQEQRTCK